VSEFIAISLTFLFKKSI